MSDTQISRPFPSRSPVKRTRSKLRKVNFRRNEESDAPVPTIERSHIMNIKHNVPLYEPHFTMRNGKKYHILPKTEVPFPRSYDRLVLDHEIWEALFHQQLTGGICFHKFDEPPTVVLELGCGTGTWTLNASRSWTNTKFYGFDIAPIQPDLYRAESELSSRVTWVTGNFLEKLPFPDNFFDFVFSKRIMSAVPENKLVQVIEEILRVMKPEAVIEIFEEDLFVPGSRKEFSYYVNDTTFNYNPSSTPRSPTMPTPSTSSISYSTSSASHPSLQTPREDQVTPEMNFNVEIPTVQQPCKDQGTPKRSETINAKSITNMNSASSNLETIPSSKSDIFKDLCQNLDTCSRSKTLKDNALALPLPGGRKRSISVLQPERRLEDDQTKRYRRRSLTTSQNNTTNRHSLGWEPIQNPGGRRFLSPEEPPMLLPATQKKSPSTGQTSQRSPATTGISPISGKLCDDSKENLPTTIEPKNQNGGLPSKYGSKRSSSYPEFQVPAAEPLNPRDHSLLERIYNEMFAARFINVNPLSVLVAQLSIFFSGVRSHASLSIAFPPKPYKNGSPISFDSRETTKRDSAQPPGRGDVTPVERRPSRRGIHSPQNNTLHDKPTQTIPTDNNQSTAVPHGRSRHPNMFIDTVVAQQHCKTNSVRPTKSPTIVPNFIGSVKNTVNTSPKASRREDYPTSPVKPFDINLKTLHLHLSSRISEILACSESMWEWVLEEQERTRKQYEETGETASQNDSDQLMAAIRSMTRAEFDQCLSRFKMDMDDKIALEYALSQYLHMAPGIELDQSAERKSFDAACEAWDAKHGSDGTGDDYMTERFLSRYIRVFTAFKPRS